MSTPGDDGVWHHWIPGLEPGTTYKYRVESSDGRYQADKADPYAFAAELPPGTASKLYDLDAYRWNDAEWMARRGETIGAAAPISIYEVHLGSWRRVPEEGDRSLGYREAAESLGDYLVDMGYTHVEFLPLAEHPFYGSWGYQTTAYFAPTARYGDPHDLMYLIDCLHQRGIGVILDWVPAHFPRDELGLAYFDGTHLYEHADPRQGLHPDWNTFVFNYGRNEVRQFLIANADFWFRRYHVDALRVDAVASMLYLDYGRRPGEWIPNRHGGRENLEAVEFLRALNQAVADTHPGVAMIAEESTSWPQVSRPVSSGGLGFSYKWNMGWMNDTLDYIRKDPIHRRHHHRALTFGLMYAFSERFILPLSHDEVVYGKGSMLGKMPGDNWCRFANLRVLYGHLFGHPGKKLLFMGNEFAQEREWNHDQSLDWHLLDQSAHAGIKRWVRDLNTVYRAEPALHQVDDEPAGFQWVEHSDESRSVVSYLRFGREGAAPVLVIVNFTPVPRHNYRVGVPKAGVWTEILNSDATLYGGSGQGNLGALSSFPVPSHGRPQSLTLTVPPLAMVAFKHGGASSS
jgi:1,4-alpha-glucan branching enzyme